MLAPQSTSPGSLSPSKHPLSGLEQRVHAEGVAIHRYPFLPSRFTSAKLLDELSTDPATRVRDISRRTVS